jgi:recombination protein RecT
MTPEFAAALPPQIPAERFVRTLLTTIQMQPALLSADRRSLFAAAMRAAQDGLLLDGREAAAVMFGKGNGATVAYMPMIAGVLKKMRNSGELSSISAHVVYASDHFEYELGDNERIAHTPHLGPNRGEPIAAYAIARTKDGSVWREVMSVDEIEKVRSVSRAANNGPWVTFWSEMARKTVTRRLAKRLPSSADAEQIFDADNELTDFAKAPQREQRAEPMSRLKAQILETEVAPSPATEAEPEAAPAEQQETNNV